MPADDLGSELGTVFVDDLDGHFEGRSGSAAERAGARFSGSLARRSPWFSCSGSLVRFASVVLGPGSMPLSVSACSTRARSGSTPAAGLVGPPAGPSRASCRAPCARRTSRAARAFSSGGYRRRVGLPDVLLPPMTPSSSPRSGAPKQPKTTQTGQDELEEGPVTGLIESQRRPRHLHNTDQYGRAAAVTTAGCVTAAASNSTICWSGAVSPALPAAINETGPASSWAEPRCSTTRLVRPSLATICTAVAPDAVLTLRKSGPTHRIPPRHQ